MRKKRWLLYATVWITVALTSCNSEDSEGKKISSDEGIEQANIEVLDVNLKPETQYVANRGLWEPKEGSVCYYAWSDTDGNGQPELFIAKQLSEGNGYEISTFMTEEYGNGKYDVHALWGGSIQVDSLPVSGIFRDYSTGALYYLVKTQIFTIGIREWCRETDFVKKIPFIMIRKVMRSHMPGGGIQPFLDLFGEKGGVIMERTAEEEDSYISFIRLERVGGLDICTFAVRASEKEQYHLMFAGEWEEMEVSFQHLLIPATYVNGWNGNLYGSYNISQVDINFDGKEDLLIHEGFSGGSGGSFDDYRAAVWEEDKKELFWYPSFPEQLVFLEFNEQRMIVRYRSGASYKAVCE